MAAVVVADMAVAPPVGTMAAVAMTVAPAVDMTAARPVVAEADPRATLTMKSRSEPRTRCLTAGDAAQALLLYNELTVGPPAKGEVGFLAVLAHPGTEIFGAFEGETLAAMVTLHLLPNALWNARPYGLIENVVTRESHQRQGFGRVALQAAVDAAWAADAYKVMLMTGQAREATGFYEAVGFSSKDKTAMVMRRV